MRLQTNPYLPAEVAPLARQLDSLWRQMVSQVNGLSEGAIAARHGAMTAAPTTGAHAQGDYVWNSAPVEAGAVGVKYVVRGWICTASGTPGTWLQDRALTGN